MSRDMVMYAQAPAARLDHYEVELSGEQTGRLRECARQLGTTVDVMVQSAWLIVLDGLTGSGGFDEAMPIRDLLSVIDRDGLSSQPAVWIQHHEIDARVLHDRPGRGTRHRARPGVLRLVARPAPDLVLRLCFEDSRFEPGAAERLTDCLMRVLEAIVVGPEEPICRVEVLGDEDRLCICGTPAGSPTAALTIVDLFEDQVARAPDAVAVSWRGTSVRYRELDTWANRLAHHLVAADAGPDRPVRLDLPLSPELVAGLLAALKSGVSCVAAADGAAVNGAVVLTDPADATCYPDCAPPRVAEADAAYVAWLGQAGDDRGARVCHRDLVGALLNAHLDHAAPGVSATDRSLAGPVAYRVAAVLLPLITGATLVVAPEAAAVR